MSQEEGKSSDPPAPRRTASAIKALGTSLFSRNSDKLSSSQKGGSQKGSLPSSFEVEEPEFTDSTLLHNALREAARHVDGVVATELWVLDDLHLVQPEGGWYRSPKFAATDPDALNRIEDKSRDDYVAPPKQLPGVGLAGSLWAANEDNGLLRSAAQNFMHNVNDSADHDSEMEMGKRPSMNKRLSMFSMKNMKSGRFKMDPSPRGRRSSTAGVRDLSLSRHSNIDVGNLSRHSGVGGELMNLTINEEEPSNKEANHPGGSSQSPRPSLTVQPKPSGSAPQRARRGSMMAMKGGRRGMSFRQSFARSSRKSVFGGLSADASTDFLADEKENTHYHRMVWRDIKSLTLDPDQPTFLRLKLLEDAGFDKAAGMTFDFRGQKGIVLFLSTPNTTEDDLNTEENYSFMRSATDVIGTTVAMIKPRQILKDTNTLKHMGGQDKETIKEDNDNTGRFHGVSKYVGKLKGGNLQPPPPMPAKEAILTFFGAFLTLLVLARVSKALRDNTDDQYGIILGPFGALMTLQYGLAMAPASQPRNAIYGQTLAISIALGFTYIPTEILPVWIRVPLATATAIASMTRLGITHPPAGAAALIISGSSFDWMILPLMLLGNVISLMTATLVNNVSDKRQYPTYMKFGVWSMMRSCCYSCVSMFDCSSGGKNNDACGDGLDKYSETSKTKDDLTTKEQATIHNV